MKTNGVQWNSMEFSDQIQSVVCLGGEIQEIASKLLLTFWGGTVYSYDLRIILYVCMQIHVDIHIYVYIYIHTYT